MIDSLIQDLSAPDVWARITASIALQNAGERAIEPLSAVVADADAPFERRWRAAVLLGESGDPRAIQPLLIARCSDVLDLRQGAIWALGCVRAPEAYGRLLATFTDPAEEEQLRFITAAAMTHIDAERTLPLLREALTGVEAQQRAAHALLATLAEKERSG